jgi:hypothetical protein
MRLEEEVLAECCKATLDSGPLRACLNGPVKWPLLRELAKWHGLRPLLALQIEKTCPEIIPAVVQEQLCRDARLVAARNLSLVAELGKILGLLTAQGIPAFSLKGPALAVLAYGDVALREFEDLDIFIHRESFAKASGVLAELGYRADLYLRDTGEFYLESNHQLTFSHVASGIRVELHWSLQERRFLDVDLKPEEWWDRLQLTTIRGVVGYSLAPADLVLFLCSHGAKHAWERWKWLYDVGALIQRCPSDTWGTVLNNAVRLGAMPVLLVSLALAAEFTGVPLPGVIRNAIDGEESFGSRLKGIKRSLALAPKAPVLSTALLHLHLHTGLRAQAGYVRRLAFTPTAGDWGRFLLKPPFLFLYPVLRPIRLLGQRLFYLRNSSPRTTKAGRSPNRYPPE